MTLIQQALIAATVPHNIRKCCIKDVAAAEGLSVNAWVVRTLEQAANQTIAAPPTQPQTQVSEISDIEPVLDNLLDTKLDTLLAAKLAGIEERLGKLRA
ncbi:hypothetical protein [Microcoleus sp. B9-D4]|uniref:hypothetical protein n=1 Tax=Microcoleus sp. B9-D4 TaxID=2818711 RepID=UPI002FD52598